MPGKVKVKIISGRNLPVMDRSSDTTDAYVEIKLGNTTYKTDVCRKSLHPQWNSEWYRFEVDDSELQDEPLQIRLMDHDTYSANDAIGKVYIDLNPLLLPASGGRYTWNSEINSNHEHPSNSVMSGWIPVYDTMHGIRGEVNIVVKVELFSDFNRFRQSSCGIQFFCSKTIPFGYFAQTIHGFVEELIVNDDPEYQWIDKIRTPRASNEARQTLFFKLSGELQRKIGVKALDLGGNAVIGYYQSFDLEGESGIVARGIGTAVTLIKLTDTPLINVQENFNEERAQSYLKFLHADAGFHLNKYPKCPLYNNPSPLNLPMLDIDNPRYKPIIKCLNTTNLNQQLRATQSNPILNQNKLNQQSVKILLKQEDNRGIPGSGIGQKFKNFKYSSQNLLSKKMTALKAKLGDAGIGEELEDEQIIHNNDKKRQFKRTISDSSVMAELLARSVIHAQTSLGSIIEKQDSFDNKDDDLNIIEKAKSESTIDRQSSDSFTESSDTDSDDDDDDNDEEEDDDDDDDDDDDRNSMDFETVSNIVKNVENLEHKHCTKRISKQISLPALCLDDIILDDDDDVNDELMFSELIDNKSDTNIEIDTNVIDRPKTIIPPVIVNSDLNNQSLMKTAMQTMLLEQLNIVGTYTPPTSPTLGKSMESLDDEKYKSLSITFLNTPTTNLVRSSTALSLDGWNRKHETVLGAPFISMYNLRCDFKQQEQSHPSSLDNLINNQFNDNIKKQQNSNCFSDSELHKTKNDIILSFKKQQSNINKHKLSFISLLNKNNEIDKKRQIKSTDNLNKRKFSFLSIKSLKNSDSSKSKLKFFKDKSSIIHLPKFFNKNNKIDDNTKIKKDGLLNTALGNVAMETVQDILATSHSNNNNNNKIPIFPSTSILTNTNDNNKSSISDKSNTVLVNTQIDKSTAFNDNMHASLTTTTTTAPTTATYKNDSSPIPETNIEQQQQQQCNETTGVKFIQSPGKLNNIPCIHRRSSDSDLSITPKGNSLTGSDRSGGITITKPISRTTVPQENFDMLEYPFLTMSKYPSGFISHIGGAVSARSVKLLERISNLEEPESRDTWWSEIRMEIRSHTRALNCNAVLGYTETTSICDDVCVLSASGTAAVIGLQYNNEAVDSVTGLGLVSKTHNTKDILSTSLDRNDHDKDKHIKIQEKTQRLSESPEQDVFLNHQTFNYCNICHLPYNPNNVPIRATVLKCRLCRNGKVPDVLITTIESPDNIPSIGRGCFIQSFVSRHLKEVRGESFAKEISDGLPFLEYELYRLLINKLKIKGMNSIFGLRIRISIGEKMLVGLATGTAVYLTPLSTPVLPKLVSDRSTDDRKLADLQKLLNDTVKKNREIYQLKNDDNANTRVLSDDDSDDEQTSTDLSLSNKDCCVLEVDDPEDAEVVNLLMEERPPDGFHVVNTEFVPGLDELEIVKNLQMFTQIYRGKFQPPYNFDVHFHRLLQSVYFKLRRMVPCALCDLQFRVDLPDPDEIQLCVLGMALGLGEPSKIKLKRKNTVTRKNDDDLIFNLDDDHIPENSIVTSTQNQNYLTTQSVRYRQKSPLRNRIQTIKQRHMPYRERHGVDITPLSYVPGGKIEHYLGNLNFFFIRETTSIREEGGLSGFIHSFITEVLAIVRAHVTALGGNAMVAYFMTECVLNHSLHKNQGQCLINVGGDVVFVSYYAEDA